MKRIVFTRRGSAGHVMVNLALIPKFLELGWEVKYIGSQQGIEADLVQKLDGIDYCGIATGKWRRYWDRENFKQASRGDQILNAHSFRSSGYAEVLMEENMNDETFLNAVDTVFAKREEMIARMNQNSEGPFADRLVEWIQMVSR